jgi:hypothetical protein
LSHKGDKTQRLYVTSCLRGFVAKNNYFNTFGQQLPLTMFIQLWNKYLPVIRILLKKSASGEQTLTMNKTDFERAAGGKKLKHTFKIFIRFSKLENAPKQSQLVKQLVTVLTEDEVTKQLLKQHEFNFILNSSFQLTIKNCNPPAAKEESDSEESKPEKVDSTVDAVDEQQ